ncbi:putative quinol monooxygenase [Streptomyces sp. XD-27]|uniref:putative quinol monooxygenase n=1 Tax=Streptomyces sp. XD-27 TaxID=3062779 RepID=UPI00350E39C6
MGYGLIVRFELHDAAAATAFDALVDKTLKGIKENEPGTLVYVSHRVPGEPDVRVFYELYADREAFEEHERQPHVREFLEARQQYVARFDVTFLEAVGGKLSGEAEGTA